MADLHRMMWGAPAIFIVHDAEEVVTIEPFFRSSQMLRDLGLPATWAPSTTAIFVIVLLLALGFLYTCKRAIEAPPESLSRRIYYGALGVLAVNGVAHAIQGLLAGGYVPGLWTSLVLVIPGCAFLLSQLHERGLMTRRESRIALYSGLGLHGAGAVVLTLVLIVL